MLRQTRGSIMGLDMFAYTSTREIPDVDFEQHPTDVELFYWRKHPNLHGWMERKWRGKFGWFRSIPEHFNLECLKLDATDLKYLEEAVLKEQLPETAGFFFGHSRPEEKERDLEFIQKAREALASGKSVYYTSYW